MTEKKHAETHHQLKKRGEPADQPMSERPDHPELSDEEAETVLLLREGLDSLESLVPVLEPDPLWLEMRLSEHEAMIRKRFIRDLTVFLSIAVVVLSGMAAALLKVPAVFIVLQAAALLAAPLFILGLYRKRVKSR